MIVRYLGSTKVLKHKNILTYTSLQCLTPMNIPLKLKATIAVGSVKKGCYCQKSPHVKARLTIPYVGMLTPR